MGRVRRAWRKGVREEPAFYVLDLDTGSNLAAAKEPATADPRRFQEQCVEAYLASWVARGFSPVTIENDSGVLDRMLALLGRRELLVSLGLGQ